MRRRIVAFVTPVVASVGKPAAATPAPARGGPKTMNAQVDLDKMKANRIEPVVGKNLARVRERTISRVVGSNY